MTTKTLACAAALLLFIWSIPSRADSTGFAVVELFTSQGCSSCPPADRVLAGLDAEAQRTGQPVFVLSHHVDYWNRLGWTDPFSSRGASLRQQQYAGVFQSNRVYTPQMIVNGRRQFVGSKADAAQRAVAEALATPATVAVTLGEPRLNNDGITIDAELSSDLPAEGAWLIAALTRHRAGNHVPRGENRGRHLTHTGVVRAFEAVRPTAGPQSVTLPWPTDATGAGFRVVAFVQSEATGQIHGAAMRDVVASVADAPER